MLASGKAPSVRYSSSDENSNPEYVLFNSGKAWCTGKSPVSEQYLEVTNIFAVNINTIISEIHLTYQQQQ